MNFRIAIPSHNRATLIQELTLSYLRKCSIDRNFIDIFVSNDQQADEYINVVNHDLFKALVIANTDNVRDKFNFIHSYYPAGTKVLVIEDDIASIDRLVEGEIILQQLLNLQSTAQEAFALCDRYGTKLWGINSNSNHFFMKHQSVFCFKMVVANMYGFIAEQPPILVTQHTKTDYERTILYTVKYGGVIRLDYLCPRTRNYKNPGGMQDLIAGERTIMEAQASNYLTATYPHFCKINRTKDSKYIEISLITKKVKPQNNTLF